MIVRHALARARRRLEPVSESPGSEARALLADTLGTTPAWVLAHDDVEVPSEAERTFDGRVDRRTAGVPLPYVLGWWEFYGRRFSVDARVLIPRPETELLVERALEEMDRRRPVPRAIDIGTGSGCIAVTLAASRPDGRFVATDVSRDALTVARANASSYDVAEKICFVQTSLLESFGCVWDLVCANLPYLPAERLIDLDVARHEPGLALDGGRRGVRWLVPLIQALRRSLAGDGLALLEIDEGQADELVRLAQNFLPDATVDCAADLAGRPRMLVIRRTAGVA